MGPTRIIVKGMSAGEWSIVTVYWRL